jgi:hypothetical protein
MNRGKWIQFGLVIVILLLLLFAVTQFIQARKYKNRSIQFKTEMLLADSVKIIADGQYQKLVNDVNSQKQLNGELNVQNKDLAQQLKKDKKDPIIITKIVYSLEKQIDTFIVDNTTPFFEDHYPNKEDWFINYQLHTITDSLKIGVWDFTDLTVDLVISEKSKGLYVADIKGPSFLKVKELEVKSLPLEHIKPDKFGWIVGGGGSYSFTTNRPTIHLSGGIRIKKVSLIINGSTNTSIGGTVLTEF